MAEMIEAKIDELAWRCLTTPNTAKLEELGLTQNDVREVCEFRDGRLSFIDSAEAKRRAISHVQQSVIAPAVSTPSTFFKAVERCWLDGGEARQENISGYALAQLHNIGRLDAVQIAIVAIQEGGDVFTVSRVMTDCLPLFDWIDVPNLVILFGLMHPRMKNDLAQGYLYGAAGEWIKGHPSKVEEVVASCLAALGDHRSASIQRRSGAYLGPLEMTLCLLCKA